MNSMRFLLAFLSHIGLYFCLASVLQAQNSDSQNLHSPKYPDCTAACGVHTSTGYGSKSSLKSNGTSMGTIQANTNPALPNSYNFQEYVFAEPNDQGNCTGATNASAIIEEVFFAQTHRHALSHPFFFMIGERPALLQVAVTGSGASPDVTVQGSLNGTNLGTLCLKGPNTLPSSGALDLTTPDFTNYFNVTLPKSWIQDGLSLTINAAGSSPRTITSTELKIGPYTELNLVMVNQDVMDYNTSAPLYEIFGDFIQEVASSMPASVVRFGVFPETIVYPEIVTSDNTQTLIRFQTKKQVLDHPIADDGFINAIALASLHNMHLGTKDYVSTFYFGNTLNLNPGGWGGNKSFVSYDYTDVFIHELGHALSLPHWGDNYELTNPSSDTYEYPFGGESGNGGGRGQVWNFIQDTYEFVSPICQDPNDTNNGEERSDCMQRNHACLENRPSGLGPWDGHGQFSAYAMHRYLVGAASESGQIQDRGTMRDYQFNEQMGFPRMTLSGGERIFSRSPNQPQAPRREEEFVVPGSETLNTDVYLIYGSAHPDIANQPLANIVYKPIKFNGTLPPLVDPTDPATFAQFTQPPYDEFLRRPFDITIKVTFMDGSVQHALNPYHNYANPYTGGFGVFRGDVSHFAMVIPADKEIQMVEVFDVPFCVKEPHDNTPGNIRYAPHNITAANFMDAGTKLSEYITGTLPGGVGTNAVGGTVWHDYDRDGIQDPNEPGIPEVTMVLWADEQVDGILDGQDFIGFGKTDDQGVYRYRAEPGEYQPFIWQIDNWAIDEPLHGFISSNGFVANANNDVDGDNNGSGAPSTDIFSGIVIITADGEPLNDGDPIDCWYDNDPAGNMTIDFGLYDPSLFVWIGDIDTDWQGPGNWAGGLVPDSNSEVIIPSNRPNYPAIDENVVIQKIEVQVGACLDVTAGFTIEVLCT